MTRSRHGGEAAPAREIEPADPPPVPAPARADRRRAAVWCALVLALTAAAYARTLDVPFQFDDHAQILANPAIRGPSVQGLFDWARTRVIPYATLALNYRLGGEDVRGYHVVNLAVHLLNVALVFRLVLALCATPGVRGRASPSRRVWLAAATALVFACHPIQVQAVTYIVQRVTVLAATFYLGAVLAYVSARSRQERGAGGVAARFALTALLAAGAFFSKEHTITLPLALLAVEAACFPPLPWRRALQRVAPVALLLLAVLVVWLSTWAPARLAPIAAETNPLLRLLYAAAPAGDVSPLTYLATQCLVVPRYLALVVLPWGFNIDHHVPLVRAVSLPVLGGAVLLVALPTLGVLALRRRPLVGFALLWIALTLAVESSIVPITDVMMEHRMYLPLVGVALLLALAGRALHAAAPRLAGAVAVAVIITLPALTLARNEVWRSELGLWRDALARSPGKARPHLNVGTVLHRAGDPEAAIPYYCAALRLEPDNRWARNNLDAALQARLERWMETAPEDGAVPAVGDFEMRPGPDGTVMIIPRDPCRP